MVTSPEDVEERMLTSKVQEESALKIRGRFVALDGFNLALFIDNTISSIPVAITVSSAS
jgi:hypothetical protein